MQNHCRPLKTLLVPPKSFLLLLVFLTSTTFAQQKEKNGFVGIVIGPSVPISDFGQHSAGNPNSGYAEISRLDYLVDFGYRLGKYYGLSASYFVHQYDVDTSATNLSWNLSGIVAGPMFVLPLSEKMLLDVSLNFGYVTGDLSVNHDLVDDLMGHGLGIVVKGMVRYNIARRWCIIVAASYITTSQQLKAGIQKNLQAVNFNAGAGFRL